MTGKPSKWLSNESEPSYIQQLYTSAEKTDVTRKVFWMLFTIVVIWAAWS